MNYNKLTVCFVLILMCGVQEKLAAYADTEGYYWRDYIGYIPRDALPGGLDNKGRTTYIGIALHAGADRIAVPVPGQIRESDNKLFYVWGFKEHTTEKNIKILCSPHPEHFKWIHTNTTAIRNLNEQQLVSAGVENLFIIHIGKVYIDSEVAVGKIVIAPKKFAYLAGLHTAINGTVAQFTSFDILAYDPSAHSSSNNILLRYCVQMHIIIMIYGLVARNAF